MASWEPVVLGEAVAEYELFLQSCRDNGTEARHSMSAVVRACDSLQYDITLWSNFPDARPVWLHKVRDQQYAGFCSVTYCSDVLLGRTEDWLSEASAAGGMTVPAEPCVC